MNDNNYDPYNGTPGMDNSFGEPNFGFDIPKFPIGQIKRIAHNRLKGHVGELLPAFLIYFVFLMVPMSIIYFKNNMANMEDINAVLQAGNDINSLSEVATITADAAVPQEPLVRVLNFYILVVTGPFSLGLCNLFLRFIRGREHGPAAMMEGFKRPFQPILIALALDIISTLCATAAAFPLSIGLLSGSSGMLLTGALLSLVLLVLVIVIRLRLQMSYYLAADDRNLSFFACLASSWTLMRGNVKRYFLLILSFIGWLILSALPFAFADAFYSIAVERGTAATTLWGVTGALCLVGLIIYIPVMMYMQTAEAIFYSNLSGNFTTVNRTPVPEQPEPEQISPEL